MPEEEGIEKMIMVYTIFFCFFSGYFWDAKLKVNVFALKPLKVDQA